MSEFDQAVVDLAPGQVALKWQI